MGFPGGSDGKESTCNAGDLGSIPGLERSLGGGHGNPLQYSCLENSHGPRTLAGYSPWDHKESDTTERLSTHTQGNKWSLFSRQEHWSGLPFPSPMHEVKSDSEVAQSCPTLSDPHELQPTRLLRP